MTIGERLREERDRLQMSQPVFAAIAQTTKQTLFSWESGKTAPDAFQLAALAEIGVNVLYVLTGGRDPGSPRDPSERLLLDSYRACASRPEAQQNLLQTAVLLASGLGAPSGPAAGGVHQIVAGPGAMAAGRDMNFVPPSRKRPPK